MNFLLDILRLKNNIYKNKQDNDVDRSSLSGKIHSDVRNSFFCTNKRKKEK